MARTDRQQYPLHIEQLQLISDALPALISYVDAKLRYQFCNRAYSEWFGLSREEIVGKPMVDVLGASALHHILPYFEQAMNGQAADFEAELPYQHGGTRWVRVMYTPHYDPDGQVVGVFVLVTDVSEQRRTEAALRDSEELAKRALLESETVLRTVTNEAQVGLVMVDKNRRYSFANRTYAEILGLPDDNIVGKRVADVLPSIYDQISPRLDRAFAGERVTYELRFPNHPAGGARFYEVVYQPRTQNTDDPYVVVVIVDITERKVYEERLDERRRVLKSVTDNATVALFIMDERQHCTFMNPAAKNLTGFTLDEVRGKPLHDMIHHTRPDGSRCFLDECPIYRVFPENKQVQGEDVFVHKDGHFYDVVFTASPIRDSSGRPSGAVVEVRDITEEKKAAQELRLSDTRHRQLAEALREADRRKDEYLAMLAHELRNPLAPMLNAACLIQQLGSGIPKVAWASEIINRQVTHMARLIDDLLDVSRIARGKIILRKEPLELGNLVGTVVEDHRTPIESAGLHLHVSIVKDTLRVMGDKTRLAQVISNLLQNANKFTPPGGDIYVEVVREDQNAVLRVRDTGIGMPRELLDQIFEPFVQVAASLDRSKGGLGLGLSLARGIIQLHGGTIGAHSDGRGTGSTFIVTIPLIAALS